MTTLINGIPSNLYYNNAYKKYYHKNGGKQKKLLKYYKTKWGNKIEPSLFDEDIDLDDKLNKIKDEINKYKKQQYLQKYNLQQIQM